MNTLVSLLDYGQSYWLDNLTRKKIKNGELKKRVSEQGLRGITSNPSIFNKAIVSENDYDEQIAQLVLSGANTQEIYDALTIKDVQDACDILKPVFDESKGVDGFVSLEVSPYLARDTQNTILEARRLHQAVNRQNCYIKIPGTKEGLPAIEQMLYEGVNINITLLFSVERYVGVAKAYVNALNRRLAEGKPVNNVISVASFFLSRIDTLTDQLLSQKIGSPQYTGETDSTKLLSKAGIASARLAYQQFKQIFSGAEWKKLEDKGARVQRPLWASTSNKDPLYSDVRYVETLIGPNTVNTLPDETIEAFANHGQLKQNTIEDELDAAKQLFGQLKKLDIDIAFITQQLENEGITKFADAYNNLMSDLANKRMKVLGDKASTQQLIMGKLKSEITSAFSSLTEKHATARLFAKDPYLWKSDADAVKSISNRLGWLTLPDNIDAKCAELNDFALEIKEQGFKHAVLLGMGGSSLCSEVARETFGTAKDYPELLVLDDTDPASIAALEKEINFEKTLFIAASKSGTTAETLSFFKYFYEWLGWKEKGKTGNNFIAITDPDTPLVKMAAEYQFRKVFINQPDIGGRYSVLSDFGLVPMALMGVDVKALLTSARQMEVACNPSVPVASNPGISLGAFLGICQKSGRDKVTFILSKAISSFGFWVEQLIAESTGKEGKGLVPVNGEVPGSPDMYGNDRVFAYIYLASDDNTGNDKKVQELENAGHPIARIKINDRIALGGEYYRWEIATATAGMVIGINPFDEPNVAESKNNTKQILQEWSATSSFKKIQPLLADGEVSVYGPSKSTATNNQAGSLSQFLNAFIAQAHANDYVALLPYFLLTESRKTILQNWRQQIMTNSKVATTLLNGPRYLHSTGQLHKGGPATGVYIILAGDEGEDLMIPGEKYGFGTLHHAQALGDFRSLDDKGRRVIRIDLGKNIDAGLDKVWKAINKGGTGFSK